MFGHYLKCKSYYTLVDQSTSLMLFEPKLLDRRIERFRVQLQRTLFINKL